MNHPATEQEFVQSFNATTSGLLPRVLEVAGPKGHRLTASLFDAVSLTGIADMRFREAERIEALGLDRSRASVVRQGAMRYNAAGLEVLIQDVLPAIKEVQKEFGRAAIDPQAFKVFEMEAREQIARTDMSGRRAAIARRLLHDTITAGTDAGIGGLCDRLQHDCNRLIELCRKREKHNGLLGQAAGALMAGVGFLMIGICAALSAGQVCRNPTVLLWGGIFIAAGVLIFLVFSNAGPPVSDDSGEGGGVDVDVDEGGSIPEL